MWTTVVTVLVFCCVIHSNSTRLHKRGTPPVITVAPRDQASITYGMTILRFFCKAEGDPQPTITWFFGDKQLRNISYHYLILDEPASEGSVLIVEPPGQRDNGEYRCVADNGLGGAEATATGTVYRGEPNGYPNLSITPGLTRATIGDPAEMRCSGEGDPQPTMYWLKNWRPLDTDNGRITVQPGGFLLFSTVEEGDHAKYTCVAENTHGCDYSFSCELRVTAD